MIFAKIKKGDKVRIYPGNASHSPAEAVVTHVTPTRFSAGGKVFLRSNGSRYGAPWSCNSARPLSAP